MAKLIKTLVLVLSSLLIIVLSVLIYNHSVPTIVPDQAMIILYNSLDEMEGKADIIVIVTVSGKGRQEVTIVDGDPLSYNTFTPVTVNQVIKGSVNKGDILEIAEHIGYERAIEGLYLITMDKYLPLSQNQTYLLFLQEMKNGWIRICGVYQGKFIWPPPTVFSAKSMEVGELCEHYLDLSKAVADKFSKTD